jgi:hypothetical protein
LIGPDEAIWTEALGLNGAIITAWFTAKRATAFIAVTEGEEVLAIQLSLNDATQPIPPKPKAEASSMH